MRKRIATHAGGETMSPKARIVAARIDAQRGVDADVTDLAECPEREPGADQEAGVVRGADEAVDAHRESLEIAPDADQGAEQPGAGQHRGEADEQRPRRPCQ